MAITVAIGTLLLTEYYATKLVEAFETSKTALFGVWDLHILEWR